MKQWFLSHTVGQRMGLSAGAALIALVTLAAGAGAIAPQETEPSPTRATASASPSPTAPKPVVLHRTETITEEISFDSSTVEDSDLEVGQTRVQTAGVPGQLERTFRVTHTDGEETAREQVSERVVTEPVHEVIAHGTRQPAPPPPPEPAAPAPATCPNGTYVNSAGNSVCRPHESDQAPAGATARCQDGTYSHSQSRRGTCSGHGGVAAWL
ncbi:G5 domain-containing protein [Aeromicrobium piscarium]|uniref:DUF3761 domain-containing protein n=1 Tax=Aeromicrobium piscarium TaxID=2590901 RepID=A0A554SH24_9ACTN|nr:G5 domain-containing protein [Aeromicrobium piscarium]TSD65650.1 DUF3761 domain-containing protein [Aeromicrobium piscarium]